MELKSSFVKNFNISLEADEYELSNLLNEIQNILDSLPDESKYGTLSEFHNLLITLKHELYSND